MAAWIETLQTGWRQGGVLSKSVLAVTEKVNFFHKTPFKGAVCSTSRDSYQFAAFFAVKCITLGKKLYIWSPNLAFFDNREAICV